MRAEAGLRGGLSPLTAAGSGLQSGARVEWEICTEQVSGWQREYDVQAATRADPGAAWGQRASSWLLTQLPERYNKLKGTLEKIQVGGEGLTDLSAETRGSCIPRLSGSKSLTPPVPSLEAEWGRARLRVTGLKSDLSYLQLSPPRYLEMLPAFPAPLHLPLHRCSHTAWGGVPC